MNSIIRSKLDAGDRANAFCLAHPSDDPGVTGLVTRLGDRLTRAHDLATQERTGHLTVHASVDTKDEDRALIREELFILSGIADLIAMDEPGVDVRFEVPAANVSHQAFLTATRAILGQVEPRRDQFLSHGMPATLLDDLGTLVGHYEDAVEEKGAGINTHVGANAELETVVGEVMILLNLLDRVHKVRFRRNVELLAAWMSAREVAGPARGTREDEAPPEVPGGGLEEPAA